MVRRSKIITLILLPLASIIFLIGWCLQFTGSSKKIEQRKQESYGLDIGALEPDEPMICQPIRN